MSWLAVFAGRTSNQHYRCLFLDLRRRDSQPLQIFTADQERRGEVGRDGMVPSSKCQVCHRHVLRGPNPVVHDKDLHRSSVRDGRKHIRDGRFIGEFGLNSLKIVIGLREALQWPVVGVVVGGHLGAERWRIGSLRRYNEAHESGGLTAVKFGSLETDPSTCACRLMRWSDRVRQDEYCTCYENVYVFESQIHESML